MSNGYAEAQYTLGQLYYEGEIVAKDEAKAVMWFTQAAEQAHSDAQCDLGFCYLTGQGVVCNAKAAILWFMKSAEQDNSRAQHNIGVCCYEAWQTKFPAACKAPAADAWPPVHPADTCRSL